ncbi:DUF3592 domain-containing protein [Mucilaginibacter gilvus]|uniref:DUF3592 domain-containing protein n=1 Tax=Mucilaginibacter gilvus TaxID=2305909 RepID=A0A444MLR6_9SPHI|nr:DUF3592 domain-containing protein [Mucilaginibacter gilvus]RWY50238.1 hypothetical protein EPL05_15935 [Mucilaginibacter gilvus]
MLQNVPGRWPYKKKKGEEVNNANNNVDSVRSYYPVVRFDTIESGPYAADYSMFTSNPSAYELWEKVPVVYDPNNHKNFMIDNLNSRMMMWIAILVGFCLSLGSVIYYILDPDSYIRF